MTSQLSLYNMNILPSVSFFIAFFRQVLVEERTLTLTIQGDIGFGVVRNCVFQKYCGVELELKVEVTPTCSKNAEILNLVRVRTCLLFLVNCQQVRLRLIFPALGK